MDIKFLVISIEKGKGVYTKPCKDADMAERLAKAFSCVYDYARVYDIEMNETTIYANGYIVY